MLIPGWQVWRHEVGTDPSTDALVYTEQDEGFDCSIYRSRSGRLLYLSSGAAPHLHRQVACTVVSSCQSHPSLAIKCLPVCQPQQKRC